MNILDAYNQINSWVSSSGGGCIDVGGDEYYSFSRINVCTEGELSEFELDNNLKLPADYTSFLINVGCVNMFSGEKTAGIEILSPFDIKRFSESVFRGYGDDPYPELLLTTSIPKFGYFGGFWLGRGSKDNYGIFYPETPPELWVEECDFLNFNDWIVRLVKSKSKKI